MTFVKNYTKLTFTSISITHWARFATTGDSRDVLIFDPLREANELREQLASDKRRIAFLFGAGTSQAVGLLGMTALTHAVRDGLGDENKAHYDRLLKGGGIGATVEQVLDKIRLCRELIGDSTDDEAGGFKGKAAADIDRAICREIFKLVSSDPPKGLEPQIRFANWVRFIRRDWPIEIFTTNYDLLIERGLEAAETPHFDGFVGSVTPYFSGVTVEADSSKPYEMTYPPRSWVRVWKLHGSVAWRATQDPTTKTLRIIRTYGTPPTANEELLIFPTRQKYSDSRKLPFVAYHDRLRKLLSSGETLLIVGGYSFGDEHINEILFEALRNNPRLAIAALMYDKLSASGGSTELVAVASGLRNLSVYGPDQACIAGVLANWASPSKPPTPPLTKWLFWDDAGKAFTLGSFSTFAEFLSVFFAVPTAAPTGPAPATATP